MYFGSSLAAVGLIRGVLRCPASQPSRPAGSTAVFETAVFETVDARRCSDEVPAVSPVSCLSQTRSSCGSDEAVCNSLLAETTDAPCRKLCRR